MRNISLLPEPHDKQQQEGKVRSQLLFRRYGRRIAGSGRGCGEIQSTAFSKEGSHSSTLADYYCLIENAQRG